MWIGSALLRRLRLVWLLGAACSLLSGAQGQAEDMHSFPLMMPGVVPTKDDSYLCTGVPIDPTREFFITSYEPNAAANAVHHFTLFHCGELASTEDTWECRGSPCKGGQGLMYVWAKNATRLTLPEGVAYAVGGGRADSRVLALQVHYASVEAFKDGYVDKSGVTLTYTKTPQPKSAGVILMSTGGRILPRSTEYMEVACPIEEDIVIHPFAFRTHTHDLGRVVSGYQIEKVNGETVWSLIGKKDPQLPQMFYPVSNNITIKKGDMIAARCTMESDRDHVTRVGPTRKHEMCNFYIMYWTQSEQGTSDVIQYCHSLGPPVASWSKMGLVNAPPDASSLPVGEVSDHINNL